MGLIEGKINPEFYSDVRSWVRQCYHKPKEQELIHCALNEVLEAHGVEAIFNPEDSQEPWYYERMYAREEWSLDTGATIAKQITENRKSCK